MYLSPARPARQPMRRARHLPSCDRSSREPSAWVGPNPPPLGPACLRPSGRSGAVGSCGPCGMPSPLPATLRRPGLRSPITGKSPMKSMPPAPTAACPPDPSAAVSGQNCSPANLARFCGRPGVLPTSPPGSASSARCRGATRARRRSCSSSATSRASASRRLKAPSIPSSGSMNICTTSARPPASTRWGAGWPRRFSG